LNVVIGSANCIGIKFCILHGIAIGHTGGHSVHCLVVKSHVNDIPFPAVVQLSQVGGGGVTQLQSIHKVVATGSTPFLGLIQLFVRELYVYPGGQHEHPTSAIGASGAIAQGLAAPKLTTVTHVPMNAGLGSPIVEYPPVAGLKKL